IPVPFYGKGFSIRRGEVFKLRHGIKSRSEVGPETFTAILQVTGNDEQVFGAGCGVVAQPPLLSQSKLLLLHGKMGLPPVRLGNGGLVIASLSPGGQDDAGKLLFAADVEVKGRMVARVVGVGEEDHAGL